MRKPQHWWAVAALAVWAVLAPRPAVSALDPESEARLQELEQELSTLKRKLEVKEEADDTKAKQTPIVGAGKEGFFLRSPDGKSFQFKLRGYVQADTRWFESGDAAGNDTFAMRRVRPIFEGTLLENIDLRIMPDFAGGSPTLFDAFINLKYLPEAQLQIGKFKAPIGLERLQSATALAFVERGLPTLLVPTRDLGVQVWSDVREGMFSYAIGAFNGARDAVTADGEHLRLAPQGTYYWGPFGMLWEYTRSSQRVERGAGNRIHVDNQAWQVALSYVLTDENASFKGVVPRSDFSLGEGGWGAFEVAGRYGQLSIDDDVFPFYADPAVAVSSVDQWTVGINWYLNRWLKFVVDFEGNNFDGGAPGGGNRNTERVFLTRLQVNF